MSLTLKSKSTSSKGFTLLEILLVVGIIAILAGIVILAINPTKQLGDTRNAQRRSDVLTILNAIYQYSIDHNGALPATLVATTANDDACASDNVEAIDALTLDTDLGIASSTYLTAIPTDPSAVDSESASEYYIVERTSGRVTVCAPNSLGEGGIADDGDQIEVTR